MLKRIYIHRYKTLLNFEIELGNFVLLLGANGAGKSAIMECLANIRDYIVSQEETHKIFPSSSWPFWEGNAERKQVFEVDVAGYNGLYRYRLVLEHGEDFKKNRMVEELLFYNDQLLFSFQNGKAQLYRDDHTLGPSFSMDWSRSGVGWLQQGTDNRKLVWFRQWLERLHLVRPCPMLMDGIMRQSAHRLDLHCTNFASWFYHLMFTNTELVMDVTTRLREVLPGFRSMQWLSVGEETHKLMVSFASKGNLRGTISFSNLSDGQKCLIVLYTILESMKVDDNAVLFVDEPENFLALPEIGPWLDLLMGRGEERSQQEQYILISHHPKMINFLAHKWGQWIYRDEEGGISRIKPIAMAEEPGLPIAVLVERGWIMEDI